MIDRKSLVVAIGIITLACVLPASGSDAKMTAEELVARHLESIGTAEARANLKTRVAEGTLHFKYGNAGFINREGKTIVVSEEGKIRMLLRYSDPKWFGENLLTDGSRVEAYGIPRSAFGQFVYSQAPILRDGLFGGVLSTAWPFLRPDAHPAKLSYSGLKKFDGRELHELRYFPKKGPFDAEMKLYFDPETYHHLATIYTLTIGVGIGRTETQHVPPTRIRLEERFSDFRPLDGMTLPASWNVHFEQEGTAIMTFDTTFTRQQNNIPLDPKNFAFK